MSNGVCAFCGKSVVPATLGGSDVHEGEQQFHIGCYVLYKRRTPPS